MYRRNSACTLISIVCACCTFAAIACQGQELFTVTVNTAPLVGNPNGPYSADFQFIDGTGIGNGDNTVTLSNFNFFGGSSSGSPNPTGGANGDIGSTVILTNTSFFNELYEAFTPGNTLSFDVNMTTNADSPTPDEFTFALLDGNLNDIPTTSAADALVLVDIDSSTPAVQTFAATDPYSAIGTPIIGILSSPQGTPEPGSVALLAGAVVSGLMALRRRLRL